MNKTLLTVAVALSIGSFSSADVKAQCATCGTISPIYSNTFTPSRYQTFPNSATPAVAAQIAYGVVSAEVGIPNSRLESVGQTYALASYPATISPSSAITYSPAQTYTADGPLVDSQPSYVAGAQPAVFSRAGDTQPRSYLANRTGAVNFGNPFASTSNGSSTSGLAQRKAVQAAQLRLRGHVGGGLGGARYEGVGWSNQSPQEAIESCCYWGTRPTAQIGVTRGPDGFWYACVLYN